MQFDREGELTSQDIKDFIEYFEGTANINSRNKEKYKKEMNLEKAIKIYESDLCDIRKIYALSQLYKNSAGLRAAFTKFKKYKDDEFLKDYFDKIEEMADYLEEKEEKGLVKVAKDLIDNEDRIDSYHYAKYYVEKFNRSKRSFMSDFLKDEELNKETFDYFVDIVDEYDPVQTIFYKEKLSANFRQRRYDARSNIRDIYSGITTGYTRSHTKFDELECYNLLPFRSIDNLNELLDDFKSKNAPTLEMKFRKLIETVEPEMAPTIYKYLIDHKIITRPHNMTTFEDIKRENVIINDRQVTDEEKETIVRYIDLHNTPLYCRAVTLVRNKVLNGEISLDKEKNLRLTK